MTPKVGEKRKHHYVPQVYLQRFCLNIEGDIFTYKSKPFVEYNKVKIFNKSAICYEKNLYRFSNKLNIIWQDSENLNIIEDGCFGYESHRLTEIFDKIESRNTLFESELADLIKIIVSIKSRNPAILEVSKSYDFEIGFDKQLEQIMPVIERSQIPSEKKIELIESLKKFKQKVVESSNIQEDLFRVGVLWNDSKPGNITQQVIDYLKESKLYILRTDVSCPFITSDNPGFTLDAAENVYNTNFIFARYFFFPVSPLTMICIDFNEKYSDQLIQRSFPVIRIGPEVVLQLNVGTMRNCNEKVLSNSEDQLNILRNLNIE